MNWLTWLIMAWSPLYALLSVLCELVLNLALAPSWVKMDLLLKLKCAHSPLYLRILSSTSVLFTLMTVQVLNLALYRHGLQHPWRTPPRSAWQTCAALTAAWGSGGSGHPALPPAALRSEGRSLFFNLIYHKSAMPEVDSKVSRTK